MKKTFFLFLLLCAEATMAQEGQDVYVMAKNRLYNRSLDQAQVNEKGYINYVNSKAARDLFKNFRDATSVKWVIDEQESTAYFTRDGEYIKVRYDRNGNCISTRKTYAGNKLDRYIALVAKEDLDRDFSIYGVTELATEAGTVYEIILQNKFYWGVIKIAEDNQGDLGRVGETEIFLKV